MEILAVQLQRTRVPSHVHKCSWQCCTTPPSLPVPGCENVDMQPGAACALPRHITFFVPRDLQQGGTEHMGQLSGHETGHAQAAL